MVENRNKLNSDQVKGLLMRGEGLSGLDEAATILDVDLKHMATDYSSIC